MIIVRSRTAIAALFLLLAGVSFSFSEYALASEEAAISVQLELERTALTLGEPVFAVLRLRNESVKPVKVDFGRNSIGNIYLVVNGFKASPPGLRPDGGISFPGEATLEPGTILTRRLLLGEWYDFDKVGSYGIRLVLTSNPIHIESTVALEIGARDSARLAEACERVFSTAILPEAEPALLAAKALSQVSDEACIPVMVRTLKESFHAKEGAIAGLARIGTDEAIQALVEAWEELRWDQRALAFQKLWPGGQDDLRAALVKAGKPDKVEIPMGEGWEP